MNPENNAALNNMTFTLDAMRSLDSCRSLDLGEKSFLLATGTDAASENWAFVPTSSLKKHKVLQARTFFDELRLPFIWPVLPDADDGYRHILEEAGLPRRGNLTAMGRVAPLPHPGNANSICRTLTTPDEAALWAEIAWRAFDSPPGAPTTFVRLAQGLLAHGSFLLGIALCDRRPAGTFALSFSGGEAGVYYFATLPEMRRSGVGAAMINAIFHLVSERSIEFITLQATPVGTPFYASKGFRKLFDIPVHSPTSDIF